MACACRQNEVIKMTTSALTHNFILLLVHGHHGVTDELNAGVFKVFSKIHGDLFKIEMLEQHSWKRCSECRALLVGNDKDPMLLIE